MSNDVKFHPEDSAPPGGNYCRICICSRSLAERLMFSGGPGRRDRAQGAGGGAGSRGPTTSRLGVRAALRIRKPARALASVLAKARRLRLIQVQHRKQLNCAESAHACACVHACAHVCVCVRVRLHVQ